MFVFIERPPPFRLEQRHTRNTYFAVTQVEQYRFFQREEQLTHVSNKTNCKLEM